MVSREGQLQFFVGLSGACGYAVAVVLTPMASMCAYVLPRSLRHTECFTVENRTLEECAQDPPAMTKCQEEFNVYQQCRQGLVRRTATQLRRQNR